MIATTPEGRIRQVARKFTMLLQESLSPEHYREMLVRNAESLRRGLGWCASHDHLDANMVMQDAVERVYPEVAELGLDDDTENERRMGIWNAAWDFAKREYISARVRS